MRSVRSSTRRPLALLALGLLMLAGACVLPSALQPTPIVITATFPPATETAVPSATVPAEIPATPTTSAVGTAEPVCTVLQNVNLRKGPGTAYNPPITALETGATFVPLGFNAEGIPGGTWVQARVDSLNQTGWVSAGAQFVSCNLDLTSLQPVAVAPPPKPNPPKIGTGDVDGDNIGSFRASFDYNPEYFVRMYVFRSDDPDEVFSAGKDGRGIRSVKFKVSSADQGTTYFQSTESNAGYCIFGGGEPDCNPWIYDNYQYRWGQGGEVVQPGNYFMEITVTAEDDQEGKWFIEINVNPP